MYYIFVDRFDFLHCSLSHPQIHLRVFLTLLLLNNLSPNLGDYYYYCSYYDYKNGILVIDFNPLRGGKILH